MQLGVKRGGPLAALVQATLAEPHPRPLLQEPAERLKRDVNVRRVGGNVPGVETQLRQADAARAFRREDVGPGCWVRSVQNDHDPVGTDSHRPAAPPRLPERSDDNAHRPTSAIGHRRRKKKWKKKKKKKRKKEGVSERSDDDIAHTHTKSAAFSTMRTGRLLSHVGPRGAAHGGPCLTSGRPHANAPRVHGRPLAVGHGGYRGHGCRTGRSSCQFVTPLAGEGSLGATRRFARRRATERPTSFPRRGDSRGDSRGQR